MISMTTLQIAIPPKVWTQQPRERSLADLATDALGSARRILKGSNIRRERTRYAQLTGYIETVALELWRRDQLGASAGLHVLHWRDGENEVDRASIYLDLIEQLGQRFGNGSADQKALPGLGRWQTFFVWVKTFIAHAHPGWLAFLPYPKAKRAREQIRFAWRDFCEARQQRRSTDRSEDALPTIGASFHPPGHSVAQQRRFFERLTPATLALMFAEMPPERRLMFATLSAEKAAFYRAAEASGAAIVEVLGVLPD